MPTPLALRAMGWIALHTLGDGAAGWVRYRRRVCRTPPEGNGVSLSYGAVHVHTLTQTR